ncbi:MAG TPA: DUF2288 domain-containing protein [Desulfuromonadaceae bacterium]|jgi:hypothetical protein
MIPSKEELTLQIDEAEWSQLRAHLERGGIIWVDDKIDLAEAALKVASDDAATIELWLLAGLISKPSDSQIKTWNGDIDKMFSMLIVSPYVLIQEKIPTYH